jgi:tRNA(His) guanylyltransferase
VTDALAHRMKRYEASTRYVLPPRTYTVVRVDGRAFRTWTRGCDKPFDHDLMDAMEATARHMLTDMHGALLAYHQSDEISFVLQDFARHGSEAWMGGVVQKQASLAASIATMHFNREWETRTARRPTTPAGATFDARTYTVADTSEVVNYLIWRQQDASRNSVNMAASALLPEPSLHGLSSDQRQERLWSEAGVNWNDYPTRARRGTVTRRKTFVGDVTYTRHDTGDTVTEHDIERTRVATDHDIPVFTRDRSYLLVILESAERS